MCFSEIFLGPSASDYVEAHMRIAAQPTTLQVAKAFVYCPICTHTVEAEVVHKGKHAYAKPGQKCARCAASLDAGYIMPMDRAA